MCNTMNKLLILSMLMLSSLIAAGKGSLELFIFQSGSPVANSQVIIDNTKELRTDRDGYVSTELTSGKHVIQVISKNLTSHLVYVKKHFTIVEDQSTQLTITLTDEFKEEISETDMPKGYQAATDANQTDNKTVGFATMSFKVLSAEDDKPISKARIFVKGSLVDAITNAQGVATLKVPSGLKTFSIIHSKFSSQTLSDINMTANAQMDKLVKLTPASMEMDEFIVLAPHIEGSISSLIAEEKKSDTIADILGSAQMNKRGDGNAAAALKRVSGLTILGGGSIYVRGLGDRYASVELNGFALPSPNPIQRVVPLDVFPSGIIGSLQVQKTFSPEIPGSFGGGYINIRTKNSVEEDYVKLTTTINAHSSTGTPSYTHKGSSTDALGIDDGYRALDQSLLDFAKVTPGQTLNSVGTLSAADQLAMEKLITKRSMNVERSTTPLGGGIGLEVGKKYGSGKHKGSLLFNYGYSNKSKTVKAKEYDYLISADGVFYPDVFTQSTLTTSSTAIQQGGMLNLTYDYRDFSAKYTKFFLLNTVGKTRFNEGTFGENADDQKQYYLDWEERSLNLDQFSIKQKYHFLFDMELNAGIEYAKAQFYQPGNIRYTYTKDNLGNYVFDSNFQPLYYESQQSDDDLVNTTISNKIMLSIFSKDDYLLVGTNSETKNRVARTATYRIDESSNDVTLTSSEIDTILQSYDDINLQLVSNADNQYDANLQKNAMFAKLYVKPGENHEFSVGMRNVDLKQTLTRYALSTVDNTVITQDDIFSFQKSLPSLGYKYKFNGANQFRMVYSQSYVYPDFREFMNTIFTHPDKVALIKGNPNLKETDITNIDVRYEHYFSPKEKFSLAGFHKLLDNPIEDTQAFSTSGLDTYSFQNAKQATITGYEVSWNKNLGFLWLDNFTFSGNYTALVSEVILTEQQKAQYVSQTRGLQGLSPSILNLSLGYEKPKSRSMNLSYNFMEERLMKVALKNGGVIFGHDDYEIPAPRLDFTWMEKFHFNAFARELGFKFKIGNILDGETVWKQKDKVTYRYQTGQDYSLAISTKF